MLLGRGRRADGDPTGRWLLLSDQRRRSLTHSHLRSRSHSSEYLASKYTPGFILNSIFSIFFFLYCFPAFVFNLMFAGALSFVAV